MWRVALLSVVLILAAVACGADRGSHDPRSVVPATAAQDSQGRPVPWDAAKVTGAREVILQYGGGNPECYELSAPDIGYTDESIIITLFERGIEGTGDCTSEIVRLETAVHLDEPVRGREIVDGADG